MALPELYLPTTLPPFKADGHSITPEPLYAPVERHSGSSRRRRLYTSAPRKLDAQIEVTQAQLEDFTAWYETALAVGALPFTATVAKIGAGVEYWKAYCLAYKADHQEGSTHLLSLTLRLVGTPSDSLGTPTSLGAEVLAPITLEITGGYAYALFAEAVGELEFVGNMGAALAAEVRAPLAVVCSGALANPSLDAEAEAYLNLFTVALPSAALSAEASAALTFGALDVIALAAEVTAALACSVAAPSGLGYQNLAPISVDGTTDMYRQHSQATIRLLPDGRVQSRVNSSAYVDEGVFYNPATTAVASGKYVKATVVAGTASYVSPLPGTTYQFAASGEVAWYVLSPWTEVPPVSRTVELQIKVSNDPDHLDVLSTFNVTLTALYAG